MFEGAFQSSLTGFFPDGIVDHLSRVPEDESRSFAEPFMGAFLLVDVVGFTAMTESLTADGARGAENLLNLLDVYFGRLSDLIEAHGGDVVIFAGDAVQAVWPAGDAPQDAVLRALQCGLALNVDDGWRDRLLGRRLVHRVTVAYGGMVLASLGDSHTKWDHLVLGEPVREATRAQAEAQAGDILVAPSAWALAQAAATSKPAGDLKRLGKVTHPVPLPSRPRPASPGAVEDALWQRLPGFLRERFRAGQHAWVAEFRDLAVMFVRFCEVGPDDFGRIREGVRAIHGGALAHQGAIDKIVCDHTGSQVCVVFGLPAAARGDNATSALAAASEIRIGLVEAGFAASIGIAAGKLFCGICGGRRRQYLIYGSAINRAARLMQIAGDDVLCDTAIRKGSRGGSDFAPLPPVSLKGFGSPVAVFQVRPVEAPSARAGQFVGRESEMDRLRRCLADLRDGRGGLIGVIGEPGIGKSRLLADFASVAQRLEFRVASGTALEFTSLEPYFIWRKLLPLLVGAVPGASAATVRAAVLARLDREPSLLPLAPLLNDVVPLGILDTEVTRLMAGPPRLDALHLLLARLLAEPDDPRPLVVILDDSQWLDPSSAAAVVKIATLQPNLLIVAGARPPVAETIAFNGLPVSEEDIIALDPLPPAALRLLIGHRLGVAVVPDTLVDFVWESGHGNPFHSEELVGALIQAGLVEIAGEECSFFHDRLDGSVGEVPGSLNEIITRRIDRLDDATQLVVKLASTIGRRFSSELVLAIHPHEQDAGAIARALQRLLTTDLIRRGNDGTFEFNHAITREAAYAALASSNRRPAHRRVAAWLESGAGHELGSRYAELAHHWEYGEAYPEAVRYLELAADNALRRYANKECAEFVSRARNVSDSHRLPIEPARQARWARMHGDALHGLALFGEAYGHYIDALRHSGLRQPTSRAGLILSAAREMLRQARIRIRAPKVIGTASPAFPRHNLAAHVYERLSEISFFRNDTLAVVQQTLSGLNYSELSDSPTERMNGYAALAIGLGLSGIGGAARFYSRRSLDFAESKGTETDVAYVNMLGMVLALGLGDWAAVAERNARAAPLFLKYGDLYRWQTSQIMHFYSYFSPGKFADAEAILVDLTKSADSNASDQVMAWVHTSWLLLESVRQLPDPDRIRAVESLIGAEAAKPESFSSPASSKLDRSDRLLCTGIAALSRMRRGETELAAQNAVRGLAIMEGSDPTVGGGYFYSASAIADVFLTMVERGAGNATVSLARAACRVYSRYARRLAVYRPGALLASGRMAMIDAKPTKAMRRWQESLSAAEALGMPHQAGQANLEIARHRAPGDPRRLPDLARAREVFAALGATVDASRIDQLLSA